MAALHFNSKQLLGEMQHGLYISLLIEWLSLCTTCTQCTLESILVDITNGSQCEAECGGCWTLQYHGGGLLERSILIHIDIHRSSLILLVVKVKRGAHDEVIPTGRRRIQEYTVSVRPLTLAYNTLMCKDVLVIVKVGDNQAAPEVRAHLFPGDDEHRLDVGFSLSPERHGALWLVPGWPRHHCVVPLAQQLPLFKNCVTCRTQLKSHC